MKHFHYETCRLCQPDTSFGLADHTLVTIVPTAAVPLGACIIEKHFTLSRTISGPDSAFSLEPQEFKAMVDAIRIVEKTLGEVRLGRVIKKSKVEFSEDRCLS